MKWLVPILLTPKSVTVGLLVLSLAFIAGCGGGDASDSAPADDTTAEVTESSAPEAAETSAADSTPSRRASALDLPEDLQSIVYDFEDIDPNKRMEGLDQARKKGEEAKPILDRIIALGEDEDADVRTMVIHTLLTVDRENAADRVAAMLDDEDEGVQLEVVNALTMLPIAQAGPHISALIDADNLRIRSAAIRAIGDLGIEDDETIAKLEAALDDMDGSIIRSAVHALGQLIAVDSAPKIARCVLDRDESVRLNACRVLGELGEASDQVVGTLIRGLGDEALGVREAAFRALIELTNPDDTFGYNPAEVDESTREEAIEKWTTYWESKS